MKILGSLVKYQWNSRGRGRGYRINWEKSLDFQRCNEQRYFGTSRGGLEESGDLLQKANTTFFFWKQKSKIKTLLSINLFLFSFVRFFFLHHYYRYQLTVWVGNLLFQQLMIIIYNNQRFVNLHYKHIKFSK